MSESIEEKVARFREEGRAIPAAWGSVRPALPKVNPSENPDEYIRQVRRMSAPKMVSSLMGKIAAARDRGMDVPEAWITELSRVCDKKRFRKWKRRFNRRSLERKPKKASPMPRVKVTRTVLYQYDQADDAKLAAFYASPEWAMARYEALRLHGGRCQCCGASPEDGVTILNVDHIKPLRAYWELRLEIGNLQVLCSPCNQGKGARHADDWRPQPDMAMFDMNSPDRIK